MEFEWDDRKSDETRVARGFGFDFAARVFLGPTLQTVDGRTDYGEVRINAIGEIDGDVYTVCFTDRGTVRRIISARRSHRKERRAWHASR